MYNCNKCNKGFKFDSELNRHKIEKYHVMHKKKNINVKYVKLILNVLLNSKDILQIIILKSKIMNKLNLINYKFLLKI